MRAWEIISVAESAFRHGQAYANGMIYRSTGRFNFKHPEAVGLPDYVTQLNIQDHELLVKVYKHAFRQGLKQPNKGVSK